MKKKLLVCAAIFCVGLAAVISCNNNDDDDVTVTSVTLDQTYVSLTIGDNQNNTAQLKATVDPADVSVVWTSSDKNIVSVDNDGLLVAAGRGSASVLAQAGDKVAVATVVVTGIDDGSASVTSILLTRDKVNMIVNDEVQLRAVVVADDDVGDVVWSSTNESVAVVSNNGLVISRAKGSATISATVPNSSKVANCTITVVETPDGGVSAPTSFTVDGAKEVKDTGLVLTLDLLVGESAVVVPQYNDNAICTDNYNKLVDEFVFGKNDVATYKDGVVTAIATGKKTAGSAEFELRSGSLPTVTVLVNVYAPVETICFLDNVTDKNIITEIGDLTTSSGEKTAIVQVYPLEARQKVNYTSENTAVATPDFDEATNVLTITPTGIGTTNIVVTSKADPSKSAKLKVTVAKVASAAAN